METSGELYKELHYEDGDIVLVFAPRLNVWRRVRAYHKAMREAMEGEPGWDEDLERCDRHLFQKYRPYYERLAELLGIPAVEKLLPSDRHRLFVCTEPFRLEGRLVPGLNWLEELMGYAPSSSEVGEKEQVAPQSTTGDFALDILIDLALVFREEGCVEWLARELSLIDALAAIKQHGKRLEQAQQEPKTSAWSQYNTEEAPEQLDPEFVMQRDKLRRAIVQIAGIEPPEGF